jgi:hypothetical protein
MPTATGIPIGPPQTARGGLQNPYDWISSNQNEISGPQQSALMRGQPVPLAWWQMRSAPGPAAPMMQPVPFYLTSTPYSRGADAHAPQFGKVIYNPIGAGVVAPYRLPSIAGPGARYMFSAIWFDVQTIPTSMQINPSVPIETVNALIATSSVAGMYPVV